MTRAATGASCATARGLVQKIVEEKDATRGELAVRECNTGVLACGGAAAAELARQGSNPTTRRVSTT